MLLLDLCLYGAPVVAAVPQWPLAMLHKHRELSGLYGLQGPCRQCGPCPNGPAFDRPRPGPLTKIAPFPGVGRNAIIPPLPRTCNVQTPFPRRRPRPHFGSCWPAFALVLCVAGAWPSWLVALGFIMHFVPHVNCSPIISTHTHSKASSAPRRRRTATGTAGTKHHPRRAQGRGGGAAPF